MENTSQLLQRHEDSFAGHHTLVVDVSDPSLGEILPGASLHSDLYGVRGAEASPLPEVSEHHRRAVIVLPKSGQRLEMLLAALAGQCRERLEVWLVGPTRGGVRGGVNRLKRFADDVEQVDSARHCKLFRGWLRPGPAAGLADFAARWRARELELVSYPGVFSHGRVDEGTAELLPFVETGSRRVLDMGCGYGLLSACLARAGHELVSVDRSATAVEATRATLAANGFQGEVRGGDLYQPVAERFDEIWTNPPFHEGMQRTLDVTEQLIRQAPAHLSRDGSLTLVCNLGLPYEDSLGDVFREVEMLSESRRFRVYRASLPYAP